MAKGKHATASANRRLEAAQDHIDRLTDQLAEAKRRARQVEAQASQVPKLRQRIRDLEEDNAPIIQELTSWWKNGRKAWASMHDRITYLHTTILLDYFKVVADMYGMTRVETIEWMTRKYPDLYSEDGTSKRIQGGGPWAMDPRQRRLSDEAVRRIQQKNGLRHADTADAALMWQQIDEAIDAGFRGADLAELVDEEVQAGFMKGLIRKNAPTEAA